MLGIKHDKLHSNEVFSSKYFDTKYFTSELQEIYRTDDLFFQIPSDVEIDIQTKLKEYDKYEYMYSTKVIDTSLNNQRISSSGVFKRKGSTVLASKANQAKQVCRVCGKQIAKSTKHDATACLNHREQMNRKLKK